jgi:isoquinoline 1-oxidoreductase beta subunit
MADINRREFLATVAAAQGAFVLGFWMPQKVDAQGTTSTSATPEINAWIVVAPDDLVTIRIAQTELGQGVWTSNAMMVCEELQCDWTRVRPEYASVNRDAREKAPAWTLNVPGRGATDPKGGGEPGFGNRDRTGVSGIPDSLYRRMRTNAASSVKDGRYYLQLAGAEARERLLLAAAQLWSVPVAELTAKNSIITHTPSGRTTSYGQIAGRAAATPHPHPETITIKSPDQWTLMGNEQKNLDVPDKITGQTVYAIDVRMPGMKWAAVKACPVYGGDVSSYDFDAVRAMPGVRSAVQFPIPDPRLTRGRVFSGGVAVIADTWYQAKVALDKMPIEWKIPPERPTRRRISLARAWSPATPRCSSQTIASTSGSAIRAPRRRASAPRRSPASPRRTSTCTCATWVEGSAATATAPRPSRPS